VETVLEIRNLTRRYGNVPVVDGVSLSVRRGEIYGFLGMNGAGKTTTIRMVLGLAHPDDGLIRLFGESCFGNPRETKRNTAPLRRVGSMVDFPGFYENLTARENLEIFASLSGVHKREAVDEALEVASLVDDRYKRTGLYSLGMKQRLGIARAILHHPELIVLDEPTNGLDPAGIRDVRNLLVSLAHERNIAVFMSSHILTEVEQIADRVGVIHQGRILDEITIADLRRRSRTYVEFAVSDDGKGAMLLERDLGITDFEIPENGILRVFAPVDRPAEINRLFVSRGIDVSRINASATGLENYFFSLTGERNG
jgi:bacitracin transport system ATP-binding protein